ncbi:hypothetical protein GN958_ATG20385 [Phytophthora infestans]|uniref:Uncharacterized protein n=1 Tax=Phytophthora infestans TaxID=4787 RepID=A0A8S9TV36_PHYIN|nr:hypothetical protein GN958_ATG20385 [Phytophthora infestans]
MLGTASGVTGGCAASRRRLAALVSGRVGSISAASIRQSHTFSSCRGRLSSRAFSSRIDLSTPCAFSSMGNARTCGSPLVGTRVLSYTLSLTSSTIVSAASDSVGADPAAFATTFARLVGARSTSPS